MDDSNESHAEGARQVDQVSRPSAPGELRQPPDGLWLRLDDEAASPPRPFDASAREIELGALFVQAQDFIDRLVEDARNEAVQALAEARKASEDIVSEARKAAEDIVSEARAEARSPVDEAQSVLYATHDLSSMSPAALLQLRRTIASFKRVNGELTKELSLLSSLLVTREAGNGHAKHVAVTAPPFGDPN